MSRTALPYCPYYCEENVWQLCANPLLGGGKRLVLLISNSGRQVALWKQRAAHSRHHPIIWDYHVVAASHGANGWLVWDLDSHCGLPVTARDYLRQTFRPTPSSLKPLFRVMSCSEYRSLLASDRRHMLDDQGHFLKPPPDWPAIGDGCNLHQLIDMTRDLPGQVLGLPEIYSRLLEPVPGGR